MKFSVYTVPAEGLPIRGVIEPDEIKLDMPGYSLTKPLEFDGNTVKAAEDFYVEGVLSGVVRSECGRCLNIFSMPINLNFHTIYAVRREEADLEDEDAEPDSDLSYYDGDTIDLLPDLKDLLLLNLPIRPICKPECKGLCPQCGVDLNAESCKCQLNGDASPFAKLKGLKAKLE